MNTLFVLFLVTTCIDTLSRAEQYQRASEADFNFFDDEDEKDDGDDDLGMDMDSSSAHNDRVSEFLSTPTLETSSILSQMTDLDLEMLVESNDPFDEADDWMTLLKEAHRFNDKLTQRSLELDKISAEFNKFVTNGYVVSNHFFHLLEKLSGEEGVDYEFKETVLNMMAQAKMNIESIGKITGMYKKSVLEALGKPEDVQAECERILSLHVKEMDMIQTSYSRTDILKELKRDVVRILMKEEGILRLLRVSLDEQNSLIGLGRKLWVTSQVDYNDDEGEEGVDDLGGGIKRNPTNEDILKQVLELRRTRRAISAYSAFLKREGVRNKTNQVESSKDEL